MTYCMLNTFWNSSFLNIASSLSLYHGLYLAPWTPHDNEEKRRWKLHHKLNQRNTTLGTINHWFLGALGGLGSAHFPFILLRKADSILWTRVNCGHDLGNASETIETLRCIRNQTKSHLGQVKWLYWFITTIGILKQLHKQSTWHNNTYSPTDWLGLDTQREF